MKAPRLGTVKTRLQPQLTPEQSQQLYQAMGSDLLSHFDDAEEYDLMVHFWPPDAGSEMQQWLGTGIQYAPQKGDDLGEKMHLSFSRSFQDGYEKAVIIGSDLPMIDHDTIRQALQQLDDSDAVFGPTDDGGYYLIAMKSPQPVLFTDVEWSTETVLAKTRENAASANISLSFLDQKADLDTINEVSALWQKLSQSTSHNIPRTFTVLQRIFSHR